MWMMEKVEEVGFLYLIYLALQPHAEGDSRCLAPSCTIEPSALPPRTVTSRPTVRSLVPLPPQKNLHDAGIPNTTPAPLVNIVARRRLTGYDP